MGQCEYCGSRSARSEVDGKGACGMCTAELSLGPVSVAVGVKVDVGLPKVTRRRERFVDEMFPNLQGGATPARGRGHGGN